MRDQASIKDSNSGSTVRRADRRALWRKELVALLALGVPMALTQLVQFSINTVDVLMIGRLGADALAGSALGLVFFYIAFLFGLGPAMAVLPMVSQALGRDGDDTRDTRRSVRMGLWILGCMFPAILLLFAFSRELGLWLGQSEDLMAFAHPYVLALAPGWPFMLGVVVLRNFLAAIDRTTAPLIIIVITTIFNAFMNYVLIFGAFGAPRLELVGAGLASSLSHMVGFFLLVAYIQYEKSASRFNLFQRIWRPDWERFREIIRLGWPIGVTIGFEALLFNASTFVMGRISVDAVAAYQIALNLAALAFMIPLGLSMGGAARVGLAKGAGDHDGVIRASIVTLVVCAAFMALCAIVVLAAPTSIAGLYLDAENPENAAVLALVTPFFRMAAAFMVFDAIQVAANQCLRGLKDVNAPMVLTGISYWVVGFTLSVYLGLYSPLGAIGVWWGLLVALGVAAVLLSARLWQVTRRP